MGSFVSGLFGGSDDAATTTSTVQVPSWLTSQNQSLVNRAVDVSNTNFTPYTDPRIANFTQDANTAFDLTRNSVGRYTDTLNNSIGNIGALTGRAAGPSSAQIQQQMNPFLENVLNTAKRETVEDYNNQQLIRDQEAGMINAFGGSRVAIRQSEADRQLAENLQDLDYRGRFDAFNNAQNQFNIGSEVLANSIGQGLNAVNQGQSYDQADINLLLRQGELQRLQEQDQLDFNFQEFDREQAYPYENVSFLANILNPLTGAYAGGTTTSTQDDGSSTLGDIAGIASSVASIAGLFGVSDERVKENIEQVGQLDNGLPVYSYNYKGSPTPQIGLIAQEVEQVKPEAVGEIDGIKTVNYDEAVKLREGGPVSANRASTARLARVSSAGRAALPSAPQTRDTSVEADFDTLGFQKILDESGLVDADGNMLSRFIQSGWKDNVDSTAYTAPIGPALEATGKGFFGLSSQPVGSFLDAFGFKDGGPVENFRDYIDQIHNQTMTAGLPDDNIPMAGQVGRAFINTIAGVPSGLASTLLRPVEAAEDLVQTAGPSIMDFFTTPQAEVKAENAQRKTEREQRRMEDEALRAKIDAKVNTAESQTPATDVQTAQPVQNTTVADAPTKNLQNRTLTSADLTPASSIPDVLPPFFTQQTNTQPQQTKKSESGVNIPLLLAGITMMASDGDSGDKILAGLNAGTKFAGDQERLRLEQQALQQQLQRQQYEDYIDYIRAQGYLTQLRQNEGLTPFQQARLDLQRRGLDLKERKLENEIKESDVLVNLDEALGGGDLELVDEALRQLNYLQAKE